MKVRLDLTGKAFGRLTVVEYSHINKHKQSMWKCVCDCGNEIVANGSHLMCGHTTSCGCLKNELAGNRFRTHGKKWTRLYRIWLNMKARCTIPSVACYDHYGGRGIAVCNEWSNDFQSFYDWAMQNGYSDDLTIDRIDVNGNYEPCNCRWVSPKEQANNTRKNIFLTFNGETHTLAQWSEIVGVNYYTMFSRYKAGKTAGEVLHKGRL